MVLSVRSIRWQSEDGHESLADVARLMRGIDAELLCYVDETGGRHRWNAADLLALLTVLLEPDRPPSLLTVTFSADPYELVVRNGPGERDRARLVFPHEDCGRVRRTPDHMLWGWRRTGLEDSLVFDASAEPDDLARFATSAFQVASTILSSGSFWAVELESVA